MLLNIQTLASATLFTSVMNKNSILQSVLDINPTNEHTLFSNLALNLAKAFSNAHRHDDVLVFVIRIVCGTQLRLRVSIFELESNLTFADNIEKIL